MTKKPTPVKVALYGMDERQKGLIRLFSEGTARDLCLIVPEGEEEAVIVDLDGVQSERLWFDLRRKFNGPAIVLSVREKELRQAIWVPKPIKPETLSEALARIAEEIASKLPAPENRAKPRVALEKPVRKEPTPIAPIGTQPVSTAQAAEQIANITGAADCCGQLDDNFYTNPANRDALFFNPDDTLLGAFHDASRQARSSNSCISVEGWTGVSLIFFPDHQRVLSSIQARPMRSMATQIRQQLGLTMSAIAADQIPYSKRELQMRQLDEVLWSAALWSARGRLPSGISLDTPVQLKRWPNLTRLTEIPEAMRLAALWIKRPLSISAIAKQAGIPYRYVCSFYVACNALGLWAKPPMSASSAGTLTTVTLPPQTPPQKTGLFSSLLKKLGIH